MRQPLPVQEPLLVQTVSLGAVLVLGKDSFSKVAAQFPRSVLSYRLARSNKAGHSVGVRLLSVRHLEGGFHSFCSTDVENRAIRRLVCPGRHSGRAQTWLAYFQGPQFDVVFITECWEIS